MTARVMRAVGAREEGSTRGKTREEKGEKERCVGVRLFLMERRESVARLENDKFCFSKIPPPLYLSLNESTTHTQSFSFRF